eukprot:augustus_masked-scaffold_8-processed-gene-5.59-mRNA-1 protein AED:0.41 eAED:0.41 QI:0/-1/0/1/-1/1/1/0/398
MRRTSSTLQLAPQPSKYPPRSKSDLKLSATDYLASPVSQMSLSETRFEFIDEQITDDLRYQMIDSDLHSYADKIEGSLFKSQYFDGVDSYLDEHDQEQTDSEEVFEFPISNLEDEETQIIEDEEIFSEEEVQTDVESFAMLEDDIGRWDDCFLQVPHSENFENEILQLKEEEIDDSDSSLIEIEIERPIVQEPRNLVFRGTFLSPNFKKTESKIKNTKVKVTKEQKKREVSAVPKISIPTPAEKNEKKKEVKKKKPLVNVEKEIKTPKKRGRPRKYPQSYEQNSVKKYKNKTSLNLWEKYPEMNRLNMEGFKKEDVGGSSSFDGKKEGASIEGKILYTAKERKEALNRYVSKRGLRDWRKKIKYPVRKRFADSRLRVKGRFIKKSDEDKIREALLLIH